LAELGPLADKTAKTLATSIWRVLQPARELVAEVCAGGAGAPKPWLVHLLVADGTASNEAAAKVVLPWVLESPGAREVEYLLVLVR